MLDNIILISDSYKASFHKMYPKGLTEAVAYLEARKPSDFADYTVFFGLQYLINKLFITEDNILEAKEFFKLHFGRDDVFNEDGWRYILETYNGELPIRIDAVPEGTRVPTGNLLLRIENTDPKCAWLVSHVETLIVQLWYPCTVATLSHSVKRIIRDAWLTSSDSPESSIDFKLHDFGYRGVSSQESGAIGAAAHLINFKGTDTIAGCEFLNQYYGTSIAEGYSHNGMTGFSIPASEHSIAISYGPNRERDYIRGVLDAYPTGMVAMVIDSYNDRNFLHILGTDFQHEIMNRDGTVVVRTDSGEPEDAVLMALDILSHHFGYTVNSKGYKVLPPQVRVIHGDGINYESVPGIIEAILAAGYSIDNVAFGCGAGLLQKVNRDMFSFAYKFCNIVVDDVEMEVCKRPAADSGKASKSGDLTLVTRDHRMLTIKAKEVLATDQPMLQTVYFNQPAMLAETTIDEIRERAN
jgi:nicotinamide phosphoribosyltransferase